ncbi:winged helix-turn-helix transcriptional regulator [Asticcacaulis solisilvae]|uniref:winged helix-turn-helix transcriptional regulator n=1 Tax=Asticcacaulis solisilvae TaxID=1217274 RepID=UPI003FD84F86
MGIARFEQWQERLGLARNVLAARLKHLVAHGVFEPRLYCERPKRYEYVLTDKGRDLKPILLNMMDWGRKYVYAGETPGFEFLHAGHAVHPITKCMECGETIDKAELQVVLHDDAPTLAEIYKEKTEV